MAFENRYSKQEKILHKIAFSSWQTQAMCSAIEDKIYRKKIDNIPAESPVFVTALPRAGTTLLLELLVNTGEFASHTYRDMPFILCPMLWHNLSKQFYTSGNAQERAHGDGMQVSVDSPEAFEEIIWRLYWETQYKDKKIEPWKKNRDSEFEFFLKQHTKKIIALKSTQEDLPLRYISKNNLNISRLPYLRNIFQKPTVLVLFRSPLSHAKSLLKQHLNFLSAHKEDKFAKDYMLAVGHYDFGENLKPINFNNWLSKNNTESPISINFWLRYWLETYSYIKNLKEQNFSFVCYEKLCDSPEKILMEIADSAQLNNPESLIAQSDRLTNNSISNSNEACDNSLLEQASTLYQELKQISL